MLQLVNTPYANYFLFLKFKKAKEFKDILNTADIFLIIC